MKTKIGSIKELREFLDEMERKWSITDDEYLGKFENQAIVVPHFKFTKERGPESEFVGYGPAIVFYDAMGLVFEQDAPER